MIFIQPKFIPTKGRHITEKGKGNPSVNNAQITNFWLGKPTFRLLTSQVPFIEKLLFQRTLDYQKPDEVRKVLSDIAGGSLKEQDQSGYIPNEFTPNAMKTRMTESLSTDYCQKTQPNDKLKIVMSSKTARDCINACAVLNMTCSTEGFHLVNDKEFLLQNSRKLLICRELSTE